MAETVHRRPDEPQWTLAEWKCVRIVLTEIERRLHQMPESDERQFCIDSLASISSFLFARAYWGVES